MLETVAISLTDRCNLRCSHCGGNTVGAGKRASGLEIERKTLKKLFLQFRESGATTIILSGGEPLLREDLVSIIGDLGETGLRCVLATNGTLLTPGILGELKSSGIIDCIRLSVEFPPDALDGRRNGVFFRDTRNVFTVLEQIVNRGVKAGINMVLLPQNLQHTLELAARSKEAGASFFRAVPLLPVGRSAKAHLPEGFFSACMAAVLSVHAEFSSQISTEASTADECASIEEFNSDKDIFFSASCCGGTRAMFITPDGLAHICAMIDLGGKRVDVTRHPLNECIKILTDRRRYLQRKITLLHKSMCRDCRLVERCRGGCLAEWVAREIEEGQPCCYKKNLEDVIETYGEKSKIAKTAMGVIDSYKRYLYFNQPVACLRALPLWTVVF